MKPRGVVIGLLGIWLVVAGFWQFAAVGQVWSDLITGVIVAILGFSLSETMPGHRWVNGIAGLWTIASAFIPGLHVGAALMTNNVITGIVMIVAGFSVPSTPARLDTTYRRAA